jgi:hypothetical protein
MLEAFNAVFSPPNVVLTTLFILVFVYWLLVIIGALDTEFLDVEVDVDSDIDLDMDVDADIDADLDSDVDAGSVDWLNSALSFFNLGQIPFMVFLTFWILPAWGITMITNDQLGISSFWVGLATSVIALFISAFIAKYLTLPFVHFFAHAQKEEEDTNVIGKTCLITSGSSAGATGQAEVRTGGSPYLLNIRSFDNGLMIRGQKALIIEYREDNNVYIVEPIS